MKPPNPDAGLLPPLTASVEPTGLPRFRQAIERDLAGICRLGAEVNAFHQQRRPDLFAASVSPDQMATLWEALFSDPRAAAFVAEDNGAVIGFVTVEIAEESSPLFRPVRYARIGSIGVQAPYRRAGIARTLMALVEQWSRAQGAAEVHLNVWSFNVDAQRLYAELGYEVRAHFMGKPLSARGA